MQVPPKIQLKQPLKLQQDLLVVVAQEEDKEEKKGQQKKAHQILSLALIEAP